MIFDKDDFGDNEQEIKENYDGFKNNMISAFEYFKRLRHFKPEGDCQEEPPDNINMYTQFELLEDIFESISRDELLILPTKEIRKRFDSHDEYDEWYCVDLIEARDQIQIDYEKFFFS